MAVDRNLFMYDLAVVTIAKNEGLYIKEWLDYHLLAGVNHFYIYDNDSPDNQKEVLQPYIDAGIVTYIFYPGKARQYEAYNDAVKNYKFFCKYMAFIDADEFIFPKSDRSIVEVVDEILSDNPEAPGIAVNIHNFGSNFQEKADYTRGILERFTRRDTDEHIPINPRNNLPGGNAHISTIANPRRVDYFYNPHFAVFFNDAYPVNENGEEVERHYNNPPTVEKIVMNHYPMKSREEYEKKVARGAADSVVNIYERHPFGNYYNDEFDDGILKYRDSRKKISEESFAEMQARILNALDKNLLSANPKNLPGNFFYDKAETFLTCLAVGEKFKFKLGDRFASEYALLWLSQTILRNNSPKDLFMIFRNLPEILRLPYSTAENVRQACLEMIPKFKEFLRLNAFYTESIWQKITELDYLLDMLKTFDFYAKK